MISHRGLKRLPQAFPQLDVRQLKREGHIVADTEGMHLTCDGQGAFVSIVRTPQRLGGERPWFVCPHCRKRAAILYGVPFVCRQCRRIGYASQKRTTERRMMDKCFRLRAKVGEPFKPGDSMFRPFPARPPGMHRKRYRRLRDQFNETEAAYEAAIEPETMRLLARLDPEFVRYITADNGPLIIQRGNSGTPAVAFCERLSGDEQVLITPSFSQQYARAREAVS